MNTELFHVQTNTSFDLPDDRAIVLIGKSTETNFPDIDLAELPDAEIISRQHVKIYKQDDGYLIEDLGSSNGTFLNQQRLLPHTCYNLKLGDQLHLGQGNKVTLIFQQKYASIANMLPITLLQPETSEIQPRPSSDRISPANRLMGLSLMTLSIVLLAANTQIGLFVGLPAIALCIAGLVMLAQTRYSPYWGWILLGLGVSTMLVSGHFFASVNLLSAIVAVALFLSGYQLFSNQAFLNHIGKTFKALLKP